MKSKIIILLTFSVFLFGCGNSLKENKVEEVATQEEHHHDHESEAIELDKGKKWKVDDNMMVHIRTMENDVANFNGTALTEHKTLSENLKKNIDLLTSNCTMKGKAHDELHKWLLPYIDLVDSFSEKKTEKEAAEKFQHIKKSFVTFNQYFQ